jgi:hypothetical protein
MVQSLNATLIKKLAKLFWLSLTYSRAHLLTFLLLATASSLFASSYFPAFYHQWKPKVGEWSTYRITDSRGETAELTFSVVSKEGDLFWLEVKTVQEGGEATVAFLVSGDPVEDSSIERIRAQEKGQPALEIDKMTLERLRIQGQKAFGGEATAIGPRVGKLEPLPDEALAAGGKNLKCKRLKIIGPDQTADVWFYDDVGPFGLVKLNSGTEEVVLVRYGKGAKPTIKGPFTQLAVP